MHLNAEIAKLREEIANKDKDYSSLKEEFDRISGSVKKPPESTEEEPTGGTGAPKIGTSEFRKRMYKPYNEIAVSPPGEELTGILEETKSEVSIKSRRQFKTTAK